MAKKVTEVSIAFVSPDDVKRQLGKVKNVVERWNKNNTKAGIRLELSHWTTHSYPQMGVSPQTTIDKLITDNADILIGMFWTKLGTPVNDEECGTVHELDKHIEAGKPALLYLYDKSISPSKIDVEQLARLREFIEKKKSQNHYVGIINNNKDFDEKIYDNLSSLLENDRYLVSIKGGTVDSNNMNKGNEIQVNRTNGETRSVRVDQKSQLVDVAQNVNRLRIRHAVLAEGLRTLALLILVISRIENRIAFTVVKEDQRVTLLYDKNKYLTSKAAKTDLEASLGQLVQKGYIKENKVVQRGYLITLRGIDEMKKVLEKLGISIEEYYKKLAPSYIESMQRIL